MPALRSYLLTSQRHIFHARATATGARHQAKGRSTSSRIWTSGAATGQSNQAERKVRSENEANKMLPRDSLPRYPDRSTLGVLRLLDYVGTMSFAQSGSLLAASSGMDVLGASLVGTVTAIGGGTIRDAIILVKRPFWTEETEYLYLAILTGFVTFFMFHAKGGASINRVESVTEVAIDSAGVGAFCVIGAQNGLRAGMPGIVCLLCGIATATFGGVVRDILCRREVRILHSTAEIYASTAAAGAASYLLARRLGAGVVARVGTGVGLAIALRSWAWSNGIRLPVWQEPRKRCNKSDS